MPTSPSTCSHVRGIGDVNWEELRVKQKAKHDQECHSCSVKGSNLWLCIIGQCQYVGCGELVKDHSSLHSSETSHTLSINLTTLRIWCSFCECEVFPDNNNPPFVIPENAQAMSSSMSCGNRSDISNDSSPQRSISGLDDSESDMDDENGRPRGLTGLQNLGNTCYMNAALQALSNCPPLTRYFLDCPGFVRPERSPMLSRGYHRLVSELWHKKRQGYVVPSSVVSGMKHVHPMFRGYTQQDTQEFLRCYMDQLHEELKQPIIEDSDSDDQSKEVIVSQVDLNSHDRQNSIDSSSSQSEYEYETCDSGLSSEKSSVEHSFSSDENSDVNEQTKLNPRTRERRSTVRSGCYDNVDDHVANTKEMKETANLLSKQSLDHVSVKHGPSGDHLRKSDSTEFVDAVSDLGSSAVSQRSKLSLPSTTITSQSTATETTAPIQQALHKSTSTKSLNSGRVSKKNVLHRSVISDIFDGKILSSVMCLMCERVSTTKETFQDLSLPIPSKDHLHVLHSSQAVGPGSGVVKGGACGEVNQGWISMMFNWMKSWFVGPTISLQDCLAAFFSADELKGDNMYSCEKCKKLRNGLKYSKVLELPEVVCIHLKRFRHEFYSSKISTYVTFPLEGLDMKPYLHKDCKSEVTSYNLVAVICHHGTAGGGHYTAYCLNYVNEQWYEFDDQYVTEVDVQQVVNCEAYVLFYRKQNDKMHSLRQEAMELMEAKEPSLMQFFVSRQWINKFNTFAEPGPITNRDFLCRHGGVPPGKTNHVEELAQPLNQAVWEFLYNRFGGGPVCNYLYACQTCQRELEQLRYRQKTEMETFIQLNEDFQTDECPAVIFAISMAWFKEWESFVRGKAEGPPDTIDNSRIAIYKNGQHQLKQSSDHGQLSKEMWHYLHNIYGGGPELFIKQTSTHAVTKTLAATAAASSSASSKSSALTTTGSASNSAHVISGTVGAVNRNSSAAPSGGVVSSGGKSVSTEKINTEEAACRVSSSSDKPSSGDTDSIDTGIADTGSLDSASTDGRSVSASSITVHSPEKITKKAPIVDELARV
ncbi:ubiquitin carboxyl-terminal hydrolase 20-like isoform X2 [Haliotis rufescens]|uniref:ubiquitin carboxyl-terminal hydrolase 20-like isoform X1 n=1 Tax=Haliotis rufescens TaxID=6454 RepID=UPI001EB044AE|nr:ubiquitin carboxyl-terminal hydrolase 20-like isoform X1 [Haliotis rufescens]XP_046362271.1 ubiquitin carboxyl-terminal hydrolase 20-like isoform X2 [Haliotis rufescens]